MMSQLLSPLTRIARAQSVTISGLDPGTYTAYAVIPARVYHAAFGSKQSEWIYSGLKGSLVFGGSKEQRPSSSVVCGGGQAPIVDYWFRLLDGAGKTVWVFKIPEKNFEYVLDKPFFHVFGGSSRKFGFLFLGDDDADEAASLFAKKVTERPTIPPAMTRSSTESSFVARAMSVDLPRSIRSRFAAFPALHIGRLSSAPSTGSSGPAATVSAPTVNSLVHVTHGGGKTKKTLTSEGESDVEPSWTMILADEGSGNRPPAIFIEQHDVANAHINSSSLSSTARTPLVPVDVKDGNKQNLKPQKIQRKPSPKISA